MSIFETGLTFDGGIGDWVDGLGDLAMSAGEAYIASEFPETTETAPIPNASPKDNAIAETQKIVAENAPDYKKVAIYGGAGLLALALLYAAVK